jgi:ribosomal protein S27AE
VETSDNSKREKTLGFQPRFWKQPGNWTRRPLLPRFQLFPDWHLETKGYATQAVSCCFQVSSGKATMMLDLQAIFGKGTTPTTAAVAQPVAVPEPIPGPEAAELPAPTVDTEAVEVVEVPDFDSLPLPGKFCPRCGSLEEWTDLLGRQRCGVCERDTLDKATRLAERTAWLCQQAQRQKPAPRIAPGCVAAGRVDILDFGGKRPLQSELRGLCGA